MMNIDEMSRKVKHLRELKRQAENLEVEMSKIKEELQAEMIRANTFEFSGDDWKISWNSVVSNRFSQAEFKKDHPTIFSEYLRESTSRRFIID